MAELILRPRAVGAINALTPFPVGMPNWEAVRPNPLIPFADSYVWGINAALNDSYLIEAIAPTLALSISNVRFSFVCQKEDALSANAGVAPVVGIAPGVTGPTQLVTLDWVEYFQDWSINPVTLAEWTVIDIAGMELGMALVEIANAGEVRCASAFATVSFVVVGEKVTNYVPFGPSDVIHIDQGYAVIAREEQGRILLGATTLTIKYIDPDGVEGTIPGAVFEESSIITSVTAALNNKTGKWRFKLYAVLSGGEILEGVEFFTNVQPEWA